MAVQLSSVYDATNGNLKYAHQGEGGWQVERVDAAGNVGQYSFLALHGQSPTIGYYDRSRHDLKVARLPFLPTDFQYLPLIGNDGVD